MIVSLWLAFSLFIDLDQTVKNDEIYIEGFSKEIYRNDHLSKTNTGGECLYYSEGLPIKRRTDLELLPEIIITEIRIPRKKVLFGTIYHSPSQDREEFEAFIDRLQRTVVSRKRILVRDKTLF